jgi:hypothetical protein
MRYIPKASRNERQVRNQACGLFWVSGALLIACMTMTALFGWSLGRTLIDKCVFAMGLAAADLGGAFLMAACGTCSANKERWAAAGAFAAAAICYVLTLSGVIGFQSESRENQAAARQQAAELAKGAIEWTKSVSGRAIARDAKGKATGASMFTLGVESVAKVVDDQIAKLNSGELVTISDGQATTISRVTGWNEAQTRSWAIAGTSAALLVIQYACLWFYGFLRHRIEPAVSALASSAIANSGEAQFARQFGKFGKFGAKFSKDDARRDVIRMLATEDLFPSNLDLARRWRVSPTTVCHWLQDFREEGHHIPISPRGGRAGQRRT